MRFGLGTLQLSSEQFWQLTLPELMAAMQAHGYLSDEMFSRGKLDALQSQFPDVLNNSHFEENHGKK